MKIFTVSQFNQEISSLLSQFQALVEGEVGEITVRQNKWVFFDLKDDTGVMPCFLPAWRGLHKDLSAGGRIRVFGRAGIYSKYGKYSFTVDDVELLGEGDIKKAFERLKLKLEKEGLFEDRYKKPLPFFPLTLGIITSAKARAFTDIMKIINERQGGLEIKLFDAKVQGVEAPKDLIAGLRYFNEQEPVDVLIVTRGGGSLEELQAFNDENLARAIFASGIPVIAGVGHEEDISLVDLVADARASTPTNAGKLAVPDRDDLGREIDRRRENMESFLEKYLSRKNEDVRYQIMALDKNINQKRERLENICEKILVSLDDSLRNLSQNLDSQIKLLQSFNPDKVLGRGYSIITRPEGGLVASAESLKIGDAVKVRLKKGRFTGQVMSIES